MGLAVVSLTPPTYWEVLSDHAVPPKTRASRLLVLSLLSALPALAAPAPIEGPAGSFEKYLPDGADGVVNINVRQLLESGLFKKAGLDKLLATEDADKTLKTLGLDPLKDIERVIIANDKEKGDDSYMIVQGKFDLDKIRLAADLMAKEKKDVLKIHKMEHGKIYEVTKLNELVKLPPQAAAAADSLKDMSLFAVIADKGNIVLVGFKESRNRPGQGDRQEDHHPRQQGVDRPHRQDQPRAVGGGGDPGAQG